MRAHLLPGLGFALLYWAVGYPAIHLAIPPGYTAPFFPPAGIALAALFVFGLRLWPAVFAGSALIQLATAWPLLGSPGWNLLGPLANPAGVKRQMTGVFAKAWVEPVARVLANLGTTAAWVVNGSDGLDEITVTGETHVAELKDGRVFTLERGMSYQAEDDPENPHRSRTDTGATLFIEP